MKIEITKTMEINKDKCQEYKEQFYQNQIAKDVKPFIDYLIINKEVTDYERK